MRCASCGQRKGRRDCPGLGGTICAVCCGTKRQVQINCPTECVYLATAREHPAAVVRKQQENDAAELIPSIRHLTERQYQLFFVFQSAIAEFRPGGLGRLVDSDVADAAAALAATLETSARGLIYEHAAAGLPAQDLTRELSKTLDRIREHGAKVFDHEVAVVLRAIETGARPANISADTGTRYVDLLARLLHATGSPGPKPSPVTEKSHPLILR